MLSYDVNGCETDSSRARNHVGLATLLFLQGQGISSCERKGTQMFIQSKKLYERFIPTGHGCVDLVDLTHLSGWKCIRISICNQFKPNMLALCWQPKTKTEKEKSTLLFLNDGKEKCATHWDHNPYTKPHLILWYVVKKMDGTHWEQQFERFHSVVQNWVRDKMGFQDVLQMLKNLKNTNHGLVCIGHFVYIYWRDTIHTQTSFTRLGIHSA